MTLIHKILYLEALATDVTQVTRLLESEFIPCEITWVESLQAFESALLGGFCYDLIFLNHDLPEPQTTQALARAWKQAPTVPVILICGDQGEEKALDALRNGASNYVLREHLIRLPFVVRRALVDAQESAARKEAEAANSRLGSLLRATLESSSEGILVVDLAGRITTYNRKFMTLCGIPEYVLAPMEIEKVIQFLLDQFQDPEAMLNEVRLLSAHSERETFGILKAEGERLIEEVGRPYRLGDQTVGRVYSFRDVTDRERSAERLNLLAISQRSLLDSARVGSIALWYVTEGVLVCSEAAYTMLGAEPGGLPVTLAALETLIHPEDLPLFKDALQGSRRASFDLRLRRFDGAWIRTQWTFDWDPALGPRGTFRDITETYEAERARTATLRFEWMTSLASNFARAFRTPLASLQSRLENLAAAPPADQQPHLEGAASDLRDLQALLDQVLAASRLEPAPDLLLDLNSLARKIRPWAETTLGKGTTFQWDLDPLPALPLNPGRMEPVLMNLLRNAKEALGDQGRIQVRTGLAEPEAGGSGSRLFLEVWDDGPGISPLVQERMFEPFFTTRPGSKGLGLTVALCIVKSYGGTIRVETEPLAGTSVKVMLPC